jgi:hypothetical protein
MNVTNGNHRECDRMRQHFDSYLDNELPVETKQEVLRHLAECTDCTQVLEARTRLKGAVKHAVMEERAPAVLLDNIQKRIREAETERFSLGGFRRWSMAVAAVLILAVGGIFMLRITTLNQAREILRIGLADHIHCTLELGTWKQLVSFAHMKEATGTEALGPEFINLVPVVTEKLGPHFEFIQGHRCTINGRNYVHLIATGENRVILSLVITEKQGEAFTRAQVAAAVKAGGVPVYRDNQEQLEIAGFETDRFLAFVVSNLDGDANLTVASSLAPSVYQFLRRIEI